MLTNFFIKEIELVQILFFRQLIDYKSVRLPVNQHVVVTNTEPGSIHPLTVNFLPNAVGNKILASKHFITQYF